MVNGLTIFFDVVRIIIAVINLVSFEKKHTEGNTHGMIYNAFWVIFALGL